MDEYFGMPERRTMNVSLPEAQERFIRDQVSTGRYRSASEVVRDGIRILEANEHRRLIEKMLYGELSEQERASLPPDLLERFRDRVDKMIADAQDSANIEGWVQPDELRSELGKRIENAKRKHAG